MHRRESSRACVSATIPLFHLLTVSSSMCVLDNLQIGLLVAIWIDALLTVYMHTIPRAQATARAPATAFSTRLWAARGARGMHPTSCMASTRPDATARRACTCKLSSFALTYMSLLGLADGYVNTQPRRRLTFTQSSPRRSPCPRAQTHGPAMAHAQMHQRLPLLGRAHRPQEGAGSRRRAATSPIRRLGTHDMANKTACRCMPGTQRPCIEYLALLGMVLGFCYSGRARSRRSSDSWRLVCFLSGSCRSHTFLRIDGALGSSSPFPTRP